MHGAVTGPVVLGMSVAIAAAGMSTVAMAQEAGSDEAGGIETVASGLTNPRGFGWGPDGTLYLAQAGWGGDNHVAAVVGSPSTTARRHQSPP